MFMLISPAKKLDFSGTLSARQNPAGIDITSMVTIPEFLNEAAELIRQLRQLSASQVAQCMRISDRLAQLNWQRYQDWQISAHHGAEQPVQRLPSARPAVFAFQGDVYQGMHAAQFSAQDLIFAQHHLRILSGLYGILRPLDLILPYRLEMGCGFSCHAAKNLYVFWQERLMHDVTRWLQSQYLPEETTEYSGYKKAQPVLLNLASQEYARVLDDTQLPGRTITPVFKEYRDGAYKMIGLYAKKARGLMVRFVVQHRITQVEDIQQFNWAGYAYQEDFSNQQHWVFTRGD